MRLRRPPRGRSLNFAAALVASAAILYASTAGAGPLPALGPAFNPTIGAWTMAADAQITDRALRFDGLQQPVNVLFEKNGTAHITAQTDHDLFFATGYVHARFRLFQMDLMRRQGEGRLSEVVGSAALESDRFELQLGLIRTANAEWSALPKEDAVHDSLLAYAAGVNARIAEAKATHQLDPMFTLLGYEPTPWRPVDTLVVKGDMTQTLNFTDTPLVMALLNKSLGSDLTSEWFPILPPNPQSPYDLGPYNKPATAPIQQQLPAPAQAQATGDIQSLYDRLAALPSGLISHGGASNNWAVASAKSASGGAMMAGDPHLHLTLPAIWFQLSQDSPGFHAAGVSIPGTPGVLIGHNRHIAWSLTDAQNQQTFFYEEKQDAAHPSQYLWNGSWHKFNSVDYDIPVKHGKTEHLTVKLTVHGPVISERGLTTSVWWAGNLPSQDIRVLQRINQASNFNEFREALREWYSPTHNFVYADDQGNIGMISAGYYPQVAKGQPWLPMPGTGEYDVNGTIPYDDIPQAYNPPSGILWTANQRQVTRDYPYYIGTAANFFDPGYRANEIHRVLNQPGKLSAADMQQLQTDTRDFLASEIVPVLLRSLSNQPLSGMEPAAVDLLRNWDFNMEADSPAATVWYEFWSWYLNETFESWWKSRKVQVDFGEVSDGLGQDLEAWTLGDPANRAFSSPGVGPRTAPDAQRTAFHKAIADLVKAQGSDPKAWAWGKLHKRELENLAQVKGLSYGPRSERGDGNTPLAAGGIVSSHGPSWRMVVDWGARTFEGVYPGGQSENPASDWYANRVDTWFAGRLDPMLSAAEVAAAGASWTWSLDP